MAEMKYPFHVETKIYHEPGCAWFLSQPQAKYIWLTLNEIRARGGVRPAHGHPCSPPR